MAHSVATLSSYFSSAELRISNAPLIPLPLALRIAEEQAGIFDQG